MPVDTVSRFSRPADYYASATPEPILPRWAPFGCGGLALVVLAVVFAGGAYLSRGGFTELMDLAMGMTMGEMRGMFTPEVTAAQKESLEGEIKTLRRNLRERGIAIAALDPVMQAMRRATADEKLRPDEVDAVVSAARKANASAKRR
jgi:hypothetical protein